MKQIHLRKKQGICRKFRLILWACCLFLCFSAITVYGAELPPNHQAALILAENTKVALLNGKKVPCAPMLEKENRLLVPVRSISELLGATVAWDGTAKLVTVRLADQTVFMTIDAKEMQVNDKTVTLEVGALLVGDTAYLPLQALSEALSKQVDYKKIKDMPDLVYIYDHGVGCFDNGQALSSLLNQQVLYAEEDAAFIKNKKGEICFPDGRVVGTAQDIFGWYSFPGQNYLILSQPSAWSTMESLYAFYPDDTVKYLFSGKLVDFVFDPTGDNLYFTNLISGTNQLDAVTRTDFDGNLFGVHLAEGKQQTAGLLKAVPLGEVHFAYGYAGYESPLPAVMGDLTDPVHMEYRENALRIYGMKYLPDMSHWQDSAGWYRVDLTGRTHQKLQSEKV